MIAFHFMFDLWLLGLRPQGWGAWYLPWAKGIAGSFLLLAGLSLWLAHARGIRWRGVLWRLGQLVAAAALVSGATYAAMPDDWVRFGILHSIAACSVIGLACLRLPWAVTGGLGAAALALREPLRDAVPLDGAAGLVTGLMPQALVPRMMDYEPILPWAGPLLLGLAGAKALDRAWPALGRLTPETRLVRVLAWPGRHSLLVYLIHQPVLLGGLTAFVWLSGGR
ncbi:DUF1624 domain-containing protein [Jannaschia sp. Os4]|nr:DUF1624 domain-containing protein [Jannaschia sp. Os4]